jgi:hypothetical protein
MEVVLLFILILVLPEVKVEVCLCCTVQEETVTVTAVLEFVIVGIAEVVEGWTSVDVATATVLSVGKHGYKKNISEKILILMFITLL